MTKRVASPTAVMIVGALAGVLSLSDYRVELDASVDVPQSVLGVHATRLARLEHQRRHDSRLNEQQARAHPSCAPAALRSEPFAPVDPSGVCELATPEAVAAASAPTTELPDAFEGELAAVQADAHRWALPCDLEGPPLPIGVAIARGIGPVPGSDEGREVQALRHWPQHALDEELVAEAYGPDMPAEIAALRRAERSEVAMTTASAKRTEPAAAALPDADEPAATILAGLEQGWLLVTRSVEASAHTVDAPTADIDQADAHTDTETYRIWEQPDAAVGPDIDDELLAARRRERTAETATIVASARWVDPDPDAPVGPPLPSFAQICAARFDDLIGLARAPQTMGPEPETVFAAFDGRSGAMDVREGLGASEEHGELPFDPLQTGPFELDASSRTRRAFEEVLEADGELHTVRYIKEITHELQRGETLSEVLAATGLNGAEVDEWVRATQKVYNCNRVYAGQEIKLTIDMPDRVLRRMQLDGGKDSVVIVEDEGASIVARTEDIHFERNLRVASAHIDRSLYVSAVEKSIPERVISEMAEILGWEINFGRDLQPGSDFRVIYEELTRVDTAQTVPGRVLAVEVNNLGEQHEGFYYEAADSGSGAYYDRKGVSLGRTFLRFPVAYSRISSPFTTARYHPVLKRSIPHLGVDFAAPTGTPVKAVADGTVTKSGWYGGNGRFVKLRHDSVYESGYAHLSRIAPAAVVGKRVKKGQVIGYVGSTGLATGPHLHFALYRSGKYIDPMKAELPRGRSLAGNELAAFKMKVAMMDRAYAQAGDGHEGSTRVAAVDLPKKEEAR